MSCHAAHGLLAHGRESPSSLTQTLPGAEKRVALHRSWSGLRRRLPNSRPKRTSQRVGYLGTYAVLLTGGRYGSRTPMSWTTCTHPGMSRTTSTRDLRYWVLVAHFGTLVDGRGSQLELERPRVTSF